MDAKLCETKVEYRVLGKVEGQVKLLEPICTIQIAKLPDIK